MAYDADAIVDRRRLKRQLAWWRGIAVLALVGFALTVIVAKSGLPSANHVARLTVDGLILEDQARDDALRGLARDDRVKALIVRIDSPGGTVIGGETLYRSLRDVAAKKPVVAVLGGVATSAGYMVALASDRIVARESTITGSIGVLLQTTEVSGLLGKLGIATEAVKSGPLKAQPSPLEPMSPAARQATQELVNDMFDMFVELVTDRRRLQPSEVKAVTDGRVFTGRIALARRLIDDIGGEDEAVNWLETERSVAPGLPVRDVKIERELGSWFGIFDALARKTILSERLTLDGLISVWHPDWR